ncbi:uncharacterized protein LOC141765230 isoform X2 [Sebastes fasciatus]|uniref:uncharacterized protein LOC141765230 isoform X2 n=1 Tax=Sebastes fasciatus TaxID=394691 RepID=UPI003D9F52AF
MAASLAVLTVLWSVTGQLTDAVQSAGEQRLICPNETIQATEGARVILQCHLKLSLDLTARTVDVRRPDLKDQDNVVLSYRHGRDHPDPQMSGYRNRTTLDHKDLAGGIITVRISSVNVSDSGRYEFYIPKLNTESNIYLNVEPTDQPKESKRFDSITTRPPVEDVTESGDRGPTGAVWKTVLSRVVVIGGALLLLLLLLLLVKLGVIKKCCQRPRGRRDEEANTTNGSVMNHLMTSSADDNNQDGRGENGVQEQMTERCSAV